MAQSLKGMNKDPKYTTFSRGYLWIWLLVAVVGCADPAAEVTEITAQEDALRVLVDQKGMGDATLADALALKVRLVAFADDFPDHERSPEYLHNAAAIAADFLDDPADAARLFERVADTYPTHELAERCRFLQAYTLAEFVKDPVAAKAAYAVFIAQFPQSVMVESARIEMESLN
jgi:hypothetical protein